MNDVVEFPFHKAAKGSLYVAAVLCILLVIAAPLGIYFIFRIGKARVSISPTGLKAEGLLTDSFEFADVARLGLVKIPVVARGAGAALARAKLGGLDYGLNLVVKTRAGKQIKFITNQYERHEEMIARVKQAVPVPCEELTMGIFGLKWPEKAA